MALTLASPSAGLKGEGVAAGEGTACWAAAAAATKGSIPPICPICPICILGSYARDLRKRG